MKNIIKPMAIAVCAIAMCGVTGCGSAESQYESVLREISAANYDGKVNEKDVAKQMEAFRALPPEAQKKELEKTKKEWDEMKNM